VIGSETKFAAISGAAADNTLVAAVAGKKIRVLSLFLVASGGAQNPGVRFESGTGGTALTGVVDLAVDGQLVLPYNAQGWFETAVGALLNLELGALTLVAGGLSYVETT
jgi:hypothetical protein